MDAPLQRILVVRLGAMGDVIHALPAVAELRCAFPEAQIGWAIEERWTSLLSSAEAVHGGRSPLKPLVDTIHVVNTRAWRNAMASAETWREIRTAVHGLRAKKYQIAIDFQGAWKSGLVSRFGCAGHRYGFSQTRESGAKLFYTRKFAPRGAHVVEQNISLAEAAIQQASIKQATNNVQCGDEAVPRPALPLAGADLLPRDPAVDTWCEHALRTRGLTPRSFAILNPGAGWGAKCWPAEKYANVARALGALGIRSVVNFGPAEEAMARSVESLSEGAAVAISCTISELIAITRRARIFIGGDTGPMHLAALLRVPVLGIFGPTDPARNGPFGTEATVLRNAASITNHSRRAAPDEAMLAISAEEVLTATVSLLKRTGGCGGPEVTRG